MRRENEPAGLKPFGETVREQRQKKGLTQAEVASFIGKTIPFVSAIENGREKSAAPTTVIKWADALGLNRRRLLRIGAPTKMHLWETALAAASPYGTERKAS